MTSSDSELKNISTELNHLSLKRQQLLERKKFQSILQELTNRAEFGRTEEAASNQHEIDSIDDRLEQLTERKAECPKSPENIPNAKGKKNKTEVSFTSSQKVVPGVPSPALNIVVVEAPPTIPAPTVILDLEKLPPFPSRTQCPECQQFIVTETFTSVSSLTWLVCVMTALVGCVAGCCFIPFCIDSFKTIIHKCPKCRTSIQTIKRL